MHRLRTLDPSRSAHPAASLLAELKPLPCYRSYRRSLTGARCAATNTHPTMAEEAHEVEKILQKRTYYRKPQYLVKWKGYPLSEATW